MQSPMMKFPTLLWLLPATVLASPHPMITPAPAPIPRDLITDWDSHVHSLMSGLGSTVSSYIASGIPQFFQDLPTADDVKSRLGLNDADLDAKPTQVLNLPAYGNWTDAGWNVYVHGNVYKDPELSDDRLNDLAEVFLIDTKIEDMPGTNQAQARNMTASIFVVQQEDVGVTIAFVNDVDTEGEVGTVNAAGGAQEVAVPERTTDQGDFGGWLVLANTTGSGGGYLMPGNGTSKIQTLNMHANGTDTGNATAYLVPPKGITVISDIDDILRVTKIWDPEQGLLNSFARPFEPWLNMPEIYSAWAESLDDLHFHYLTTTPEQVTRNYMEFIFKTYPLGSFDTRPLNFSDVAATLSIRQHLLDRIFQTFPERKFVLVGDTSNSDVMKSYPQLAKDYPENVQCIWLRNTSATDSSYRFPYDTKGFNGLQQSRFMFFRTPDDLWNLNIAGGESVPQNVTYGWQGPVGLSGGVRTMGSVWMAVLAAVGSGILAAW